MPLPLHPTPSVIALLFVLFLSRVVSAATASHRCMFDGIRKQAGTESVVVVREVPRRGQSGLQAYSAAEGPWAPIHIEMFAGDLEDPSKYCTEVGQHRHNFINRNIVCTSDNILTASKRAILLEYIIPGAIKLHAGRLSVRPITGVVRVPRFTRGLCAPFTIPSEHHTTGVSGADMVLYVAAGPSGGAAAWAGSCARLENNRPFIGVMNYDPMAIEATDMHIRVGAHEIAHALGFDFADMNMRDIVREVFNVRGKSYVTVVFSPLTRQSARKHYGCADAKGMELEDEGLKGTSFSHWERRNAKDELMVGFGGSLRYTALTMALFEDLGYFKANFSMAETMRWGKDAGCDFLNKPCLVAGVSSYPDMFCNQPMDSKRLLCTFDRLSLGFCTLNRHPKQLPAHFQYFGEPTLGGVGLLTDYCPFVHEYNNTGCTNGEVGAMPGSRIGPNSRCLKGNSLRMGELSPGDVGVNTQCGKGTLSVQLFGDDNWYTCKEGDYITPNTVFTSGSILCPKYIDVCPTSHMDGDSRPILSADGNASNCVGALFPSVFLAFLTALLPLL